MRDAALDDHGRRATPTRNAGWTPTRSHWRSSSRGDNVAPLSTTRHVPNSRRRARPGFSFAICRGAAVPRARRAPCCPGDASVGNGQADAAWEDLLACHRLARLVGKAGRSLEALFGIGIEQIACRAEISFLDHAKPDAKRLEGCLRDLMALPPMPEVVEKFDFGERLGSSNHHVLDRQGVDDSQYGFGKDSRDRPGSTDAVFTGVDWDPALELATAGSTGSPLRSRKTGPTRIANSTRSRPSCWPLKDSKRVTAAGESGDDAEGEHPGERVRSSAILDLILLPPPWKRCRTRPTGDRQTFDNVVVAFALACISGSTAGTPTARRARAEVPERGPARPLHRKRMLYRADCKRLPAL